MKPLIPREMHAKTLSNIIVLTSGILLTAFLLYFGRIMGFIGSLVDAALPFIIGVGIAFLVLPIVKRVESFFNKILFRRRAHPKLSRMLATVIAVLVLLAIVTGFVAILIPQLYNSIKSLLMIVSRLIAQYTPQIERFLLNLKFLNFEGESLVVAWENVTSQLMNILNYSSVVMNGVWAFSSSIYTTVFQTLVGLIAAFYLLIDKERLCAQAKKICYAIWKKPTCATLIHWARRANQIFAGFITGKILDSLIIGVICYFFMLIARIEYSLLISVIIGVTNIIPFFGPFIGAVPCVLILLLINPIHALVFGIFIIVLQQIDGNVIGPFILGDYVGLSPIWIMLSIVVGSALFGFVGMLLGVPVFALIYAIAHTMIDLRLKRRNMPVDLEFYKGAPEDMPTDMAMAAVEDTMAEAEEEPREEPDL